jgi:hypothetical protein
MAEDRWPMWAAEQAGTNRHPTAAATLAGFALLAALALGATTQSGGQQTTDPPGRGSLCDQHAGRPGWDAVCEDARRR